MGAGRLQTEIFLPPSSCQYQIKSSCSYYRVKSDAMRSDIDPVEPPQGTLPWKGIRYSVDSESACSFFDRKMGAGKFKKNIFLPPSSCHSSIIQLPT
jgi:hypothetical protein